MDRSDHVGRAGRALAAAGITLAAAGALFVIGVTVVTPLGLWMLATWASLIL